MTVYWPDNAKQTFGTEILRADHPFGQSDLFSDDGLAHLLDHYPRSSLDIWTFGKTKGTKTPALRGRAPHMSGHEIVDAVKSGHIWLNLRRANDELDALKPIADEIFGSLESATERRARKRDVSLLISSPGVDVNYHLDLPVVALFQLRGRKRLWVYPKGAEFAPPEHIEQIVHMTREEELPYQRSFDKHARLFDLKPGMALTWPQLAPHRVQNGNCLNVSLSCEFMTLRSEINIDATYTNALLRQSLRLSPASSDGIGPASIGKAAFARLHKRMNRGGPRPGSTPVTFELDASVENCVKPLWA